MTEARKLTLDFILGYFKYLSKWNKSHSLASMIYSFDHYYKVANDKVMLELEIIAEFEMDDTIKNFANGEKVMSMNDMYNLLIIENRDSKLNELLNETKGN